MNYFLAIMLVAALLSFYLALHNEKKFQGQLNKLDDYKKGISNCVIRLQQINSSNGKSEKE